MLYKYLKREFAEALATRGVVRIGTLDEFRSFEAEDLARRDSEEGRKEVRRPYPHTILDGGPDDEEKRQGLARDLGFVVPPGARRVEAAHNVVTQQTESANLYIYSTAEAFDPELLREFGADEAVVITNPYAFFRAIGRRLADRVVAGRVSSCVYAPRVHNDGQVPNVHPCWLKDPRYQYQREVRAAWQPTSDVVAPLVMECPELALFCTIHKGDEAPSIGTTFRDRTLKRALVELDGLDFENCSFVDCLLIYGGGPLRLTGNEFMSCTWQLEGCALSTLALLRDIHAQVPRGMRSQVVDLLETPSAPRQES